MKAFLSAITLAVLAGCAQEPADLESEIGSVIESYVQSVNDGDYELLRSIWVETNDASYVNPFSRVDSIAGLASFWQTFLVEGFSARDLKPSIVAIHAAGGEAAWAIFDWQFDATAADGEPFQSAGWETQIYRLTDDGWKIEHVHYSAPQPAQE